MHRPNACSAVALALLLAACGGSSGSGSSDAPIALTFSPTPFSASFAQGDFVQPVTLNVTLSRLPTETVYAVMVVDQPVLASTTLDVTEDGNTFSAPLIPSCTLAPGTHAGNMTLQICTDPRCLGRLPVTGNVLPYVFTVGAGEIITARIGGVDVPGIISQCSAVFPSAKVGQLVELTSSLPVTWATSVGTSAGIPVVSGETSTSTTWSGTVSERNGNDAPGAYYGVVFVHATPTGGGPTLDASISVVGG